MIWLVVGLSWLALLTMFAMCGAVALCRYKAVGRYFIVLVMLVLAQLAIAASA